MSAYPSSTFPGQSKWSSDDFHVDVHQYISYYSACRCDAGLSSWCLFWIVRKFDTTMTGREAARDPRGTFESFCKDRRSLKKRSQEALLFSSQD
jgi:hypothetical protein